MKTPSSTQTSFLTDDFLLQSDFAKVLYHSYAKDLPIIDYHCHLSPRDIAENRNYGNLTEIWLEGDHYKWRAMRTLGIPEKYITGNATHEEKFEKWAFTVPYTLRNPLFHWTHLELQRYFGITSLLNPDTADQIYRDTSQLLNTPEYSTRSILKKMNVELVCTTDDPADSLEHHRQVAGKPFHTKLLPAFRPDKAFAVESPGSYNEYLNTLGEVAGIEINSYRTLLEALQKRMEYFHDNGCRLSDHGLEQLYYPQQDESRSVEELFWHVKHNKPLSPAEVHYFKYEVLIELCKMYHAKGWTQQFHLGALRSTNSRMLKELGPDTGFDSIGDFPQAGTLARFLNELDSTNQLCKTVLYNLNPAYNEVIATMIGNFNDGSVKGKIQFGSAWWFLDQKDGMERQINALSTMGLLSCFIGMLTDSRSFMSFPRHEYFRRILCNLIGADVEKGELPADEKWLGKIVADICCHNAKEYFRF